MNALELLIAATHERLARIEKQLGIEGMTPSQAKLDRLINEGGDE